MFDLLLLIKHNKEDRVANTIEIRKKALIIRENCNFKYFIQARFLRILPEL